MSSHKSQGDEIVGIALELTLVVDLRNLERDRPVEIFARIHGS